MFSAVLFSPDHSSSLAVEELATCSRQVSIQRILSRYPQPLELSKILNTCVPDLVFLNLADWESVLVAAKAYSRSGPAGSHHRFRRRLGDPEGGGVRGGRH
jgi:hypothetical protein